MCVPAEILTNIGLLRLRTAATGHNRTLASKVLSRCSFSEQVSRQPLQREDLLLILESLETSSTVLRAALEEPGTSGPATRLSASRATLDTPTRWRWARFWRTPVFNKFLTWVLRYHFPVTVAIQVSDWKSVLLLSL